MTQPLPHPDDQTLAATLDAALAPGAAPAGLDDAVLNATRGLLPAPAVAGRIGGSSPARVWLAAAAVIGLAATAGWLAWPAATPPAGTPVAAAGGDRGVLPLDDEALLAEADGLLSGLVRLEERLPAVPAFASADDGGGSDLPAGLLAGRLVDVAAGPWAHVGLEGVDGAIAWETRFEAGRGDARVF